MYHRLLESFEIFALFDYIYHRNVFDSRLIRFVSLTSVVSYTVLLL